MQKSEVTVIQLTSFFFLIHIQIFSGRRKNNKMALIYREFNAEYENEIKTREK